MVLVENKDVSHLVRCLTKVATDVNQTGSTFGLVERLPIGRLEFSHCFFEHKKNYANWRVLFSCVSRLVDAPHSMANE